MLSFCFKRNSTHDKSIVVNPTRHLTETGKWNKKPVAFVGYGTLGAARAIDQLVAIVSKMGMVPLSQSVISIIKSWSAIQPDGTLDEAFVLGKPEKVAENLIWWANQVKK